jgi:hypothetical protein
MTRLGVACCLSLFVSLGWTVESPAAPGIGPVAMPKPATQKQKNPQASPTLLAVTEVLSQEFELAPAFDGTLVAQWPDEWKGAWRIVVYEYEKRPTDPIPTTLPTALYQAEGMPGSAAPTVIVRPMTLSSSVMKRYWYVRVFAQDSSLKPGWACGDWEVVKRRIVDTNVQPVKVEVHVSIGRYCNKPPTALRAGKKQSKSHGSVKIKQIVYVTPVGVALTLR